MLKQRKQEVILIMHMRDGSDLSKGESSTGVKCQLLDLF